jgi:hypothetical protein
MLVGTGQVPSAAFSGAGLDTQVNIDTVTMNYDGNTNRLIVGQ